MNETYWTKVSEKGGSTTYERHLVHGVVIRVKSSTSDGVAEAIVFVPNPIVSVGPYR